MKNSKKKAIVLKGKMKLDLRSVIYVAVGKYNIGMSNSGLAINNDRTNTCLKDMSWDTFFKLMLNG
jgi:hypothetical protein